MHPHILLVDDEPEILEMLARTLRTQQYEVSEANTAEEAATILAGGGIDLLITDVQMPGMSGLELMSKMRDAGQQIPSIVMSGAGKISIAVEAVKLGALDFVEKPVRPERLLMTLETCLRYARLAEAHAQLKDEISGERTLLGDSPPMQQLRALVKKVAGTEARVLITGENGTGKELVANALHTASERRDRPFVKLNCSAMPSELVESELFGHEKGAFTGAANSRKGRFQLADGGTLFLDEIGDMSLSMQPKLLRVLQEGQFERVGGDRTYHVDVRVIAATNKDLPEMVREGQFREDLYFRLNVVSIQTTPLRQRSGDITTLAIELGRQAARRNGRSAFELSDAALDALRKYAFPGNVRELQNVMERLVILADADVVQREEVELILSGGYSLAVDAPPLYREGEKLTELVRDAERRIVLEAVGAHDGNKSAAARTLGVERSHFYKKCKLLGIDD